MCPSNVVEEVSFSIDVNLTDHLASVSNYPEKALLEFVNNSYDADATKVDINIVSPSFDESFNGKEGYIEVRDNGVGMTKVEVKNYYMRIADNRRESRSQRTLKGRQPRGRKGIGKFAATTLSDNLELISIKDGFKTTLLIDFSKFRNSKADLSDLKGTITSEKSGDSTGTIVKLTKLREISFNFHNLENLLIEHYFKDSDFSVYINGKKTNITHPVGKKIRQKKIIIDSIEGDILADLVILDQFNKKLAGIYFIVDGRPTEPRKTSWGEAENLPLSIQGRIFGTVSVPKLDQDIVDLMDNIRTELPVIKQIIKKVGNHIYTVGKSIIPEQIEKTAETLLEKPRIISEINNLPKYRRPLGRSLIKELVRHCPTESETVLETIATLAVRALALPEMELVLDKLRNAEDDDVITLAALLEKRALRELSLIVQLVDTRLVAIDKLHTLISAYKTPESEIHKLIEKHPWLFGEEYHYFSSNRPLSTSLQEKFGNPRLLAKNDLSKRPDLFFCDQLEKEVLIVELKPPQEPLNWKYYEQANKYSVITRKFCSSPDTIIKTFLVGSEIDEELKIHLNDNPPKRFHAKLWNDIFREAKIRLEYIREELKTQEQEEQCVYDDKDIAEGYFKERSVIYPIQQVLS